MNIGQMNKRITLLKPDTVPEKGGGQKPNPDGDDSGFIEVVKVWAEKKKPKIRTIVIGNGVDNDFNFEFSIRYFPDIELGWRVKCEGKIYDVLNAYSEGRVETFITCREVMR